MGKTLLAKAVAGEAGVNFFSISASQFVEIYVGVGASRVRALYQEAKENVCVFFSYSIIFCKSLGHPTASNILAVLDIKNATNGDKRFKPFFSTVYR